MAEGTLDQVRSRTDHVVVLMLENRSFDHLFGCLGLPGVPPPGVEHANPPLDLSHPSVGTEATVEQRRPRVAPRSAAFPRRRQAADGRPSGWPVPHDGFVEAYRLERRFQRLRQGGAAVVGDLPGAGGWQEQPLRPHVAADHFDEHGGFSDRESPPATTHPEAGSAVRHPINFTRRLVSKFIEHRNSPFDFKRLGVRVPKIVISPLVGTESTGATTTTRR